MELKRIIEDFNFEKPFLNNGMKTHLSLVDAGANLQEVLVMKGKTTRATVSVDDYQDDGTSRSSRDTVEIYDYEGSDYLYITESTYNVVDYSIKKQ